MDAKKMRGGGAKRGKGRGRGQGRGEGGGRGGSGKPKLTGPRQPGGRGGRGGGRGDDRDGPADGGSRGRSSRGRGDRNRGRGNRGGGGGGNRGDGGGGGNRGDGGRSYKNNSNNRSGGGGYSRGQFEAFEDYLGPDAVVAGLETGAMVRGKIRINPKNFEQSFLPGTKGGPDIMIAGLQDRNRALEGDGVVVELFDQSLWSVQENRAIRGERLREWKPESVPDVLAIQPDTDTALLVRCKLFGLPAKPTRSSVAAVMSMAMVRTEQVVINSKAGGKFLTVWVSCDDDLQAKMVMLLAGRIREDKVEVETARGDGPLLPIAELPTAVVQAQGKVVLIESHDPLRLFCGQIRPHNKGTFGALFVSKDYRVPRILIQKVAVPEGFSDDPSRHAETLFACRITSWPKTSIYAHGVLEEQVGIAGDIEAETQAILIENGVDQTDFPPSVLDSLPKVDADGVWRIPEEELAKRRDLRKEQIFSIDPPTARDLDDALSWRPLDNGCCEIGVHIADVTYFMQPGTDLDSIAAKRSTTTYLVQRCYPMLPRLLCENLCSLTENEDRLAFSVIWKFDGGGKIVDEWFGKTVINSCAKLAYDHAQAVIEEPNLDWEAKELEHAIGIPATKHFPAIHGGHTAAAVKQCVLKLHEMAQRLRRKRFANGALRLDQIKVGFRRDEETGLPFDCFPYKTRDSNKLVEEFMLLANMAVAKKIFDGAPNHSLLRMHPNPQPQKLEEMIKTCRNLGISVAAGSSADLQRTLSRLQGSMDNGPFLIIQMLCTVPMQNALYFCTEDVFSGENGEAELRRCHHYALNVPFYTHFTSPIRRMADVVVHRVLFDLLQGNDPETSYVPEQVREQANRCNERKMAAKKAQEASQHLYTCVFIDEQGPFTEKASVLEVNDRSFDVLVERFGIKARVLMDDHAGVDKYFYNERTSTITIDWRAEEDEGALDDAAVQANKNGAALGNFMAEHGTTDGGDGGSPSEVTFSTPGDAAAAAPAAAKPAAANRPAMQQDIVLFKQVMVHISADRNGSKMDVRARMIRPTEPDV